MRRKIAPLLGLEVRLALGECRGVDGRAVVVVTLRGGGRGVVLLYLSENREKQGTKPRKPGNL